MKKERKKEYLRVRADTGQHVRILLVGLLLGVVAFVPVVVRLVGLMVTEYDNYAEKALQNQTRSTTVSASRGTIYDQNMNILAYSESVENIYLNPHELKQSGADLEQVAKDLGEMLSLDPAWISKQGQDMALRYKKIAADVDTVVAGKVREYIQNQGLSGVHLEPSSKRVYPSGTLAAQVIGFTNASNTGSEGIEAAYDSYLSGVAGEVITTKGSNEMDMPFSYENYLASQDGCSIILTLDTTVQQCLENRMSEAIARYDVQNGAFGMVMNAKTGEILAMATLGSYDPNDYQQIQDEQLRSEIEEMRLSYLQYPSDSEAYEKGKAAYQQALQSARLQQWRNRCISDGYEPGSTFKVLTLAAALDCGAVDLETSFHCSGAEQIPGRSQRLHCWRSAGHGAEKTPQALQNSCNLAFAHIGLKLGGEQFYSYIRNFGVLEKTGLDLYGESSGVFFDKSIITNTQKWGTASLTSAAFGQTFKLTPLQLVRAIASVVNGGYLLEPYIVSEVVNAAGQTVLKQEPTVIRQVISNETSKTMCQLLESVVAEGTAKNAQVAGFSIGGKTGTSEKIDVFDANGQRVLDKIVSFVGVAPMDDPEYIVLVALDTPSRQTGIYISGGVMAAPTVGAVMADILPYLGVTKNTQDAVVPMEDMTDMTLEQAQTRLKELGLTAVVRGEGERVSTQIPLAGQSIAVGTEVILYLSDSKEERISVMPDFIGMNRQQASDAAAAAGVHMLVKGNTDIDLNVVVTLQSIDPGSQIPVGTTVELTFTDTKVYD